MDNNKNIIYMIITGFLIIIFIAMYICFDDNKGWVGNDFDKRVEEYIDRTIQNKIENENEVKLSEKVLEKTPGIVCWGDGITYGTYGNGTTYVSVLKEFLADRGYPYEVINLGVYGEDSRTVLGRAGALPFVIKDDFKIEGTGSELIKIAIISEDGNEVNPCIQDYNPGFNPCVVAGVKCKIYGETKPDNINKASAYFLSRQDNSNKIVDVPAGTIVNTMGSTAYKNYINILQIGDGGGYSTDTELIEQQVKFVESLEGSEKYIILGRISGSEEDNRTYDSAMERAFGNHYINIRKELTGQEILGVEYSARDKDSMEMGIVPECLKTKEYLNRDGYKALGEIVYNRLEELGFI